MSQLQSAVVAESTKCSQTVTLAFVYSLTSITLLMDYLYTSYIAECDNEQQHVTLHNIPFLADAIKKVVGLNQMSLELNMLG